MEDTPTDSPINVTSTNQASGLVLLLLTKLDAASDHIEDLSRAFQADDPDRTFMINMRLQSIWNEAYVAILVLEQLSGCSETNARNALNQSCQRARVPQALASNILSRLPNAHHNLDPRPNKCRVSQP
jgi:hypothetical protein